MPQPQNSPRGSFGKKKITIGDSNLQANSTGIYLSAGLALSGKTAMATQNSTGVIFPDQIQINAARYINANSTAFIVTAEATLPTTDNGAAFTIISNSTGVAIAVNSTGTTWKYLNVTSVQPT